MTGQSLLDIMEDLNNELQLQTSEAHTVRGLRALNTAQDHFETLAANDPNTLGSNTSTVVTAASTETTAFPTALIRVDAVWFIDPDTSLPVYELEPIEGAGAHALDLPWPLLQTRAVTSGRPSGYWTNGSTFYWQPLPDAVHTLRWYGWQRQTAITAGGTFLYDDGVAEALAALAVEILRIGFNDTASVTVISHLAREVLHDVLKMMRRFQRRRPQGRTYEYMHTT
jgi:hypothetical protein